jgi:hypothetical protein
MQLVHGLQLVSCAHVTLAFGESSGPWIGQQGSSTKSCCPNSGLMGPYFMWFLDEGADPGEPASPSVTIVTWVHLNCIGA